jgi:hypothetical protein
VNSGFVRGVGALVPEVPPELEHPLHAAQGEPLEVQLGRDAEVERQAVGVDRGDERAGLGVAVHGLQHRGLDLVEATAGQHLPQR